MPDKSGTPVSAAAKDGSDIKVKIVEPDPAFFVSLVLRTNVVYRGFS
jgi:hypothetical protein